MMPNSKLTNGARTTSKRTTEPVSVWILCAADSNFRLHCIGRTIRKAGYNVAMSSSSHNAVALAVLSSRFQAAVIDEDLVLDDHSVAQSLKAVRQFPILLVCDSGPGGGGPPAGVDLVTSNGSRQQILAGLAKLLNHHALSRSPMSPREVRGETEEFHA
jgi:hypothetical protein